MKHLIILFTLIFSCADENKKNIIAICEQGKGCEIARTNISQEDIKSLPGKNKDALDKNSILLLNGCEWSIKHKMSEEEIHLSFQGTGRPAEISNFNLRKYFLEKGCLQEEEEILGKSGKNCPNPVKKISFSVQSPEFSGSSYFYLDINKNEAYMPDAAFQQMNVAQGGTAGMKVDSFFRDSNYITYMVDQEGNKWMTSMPLGTSMGTGSNEKESRAIFDKNFKATGSKTYNAVLKADQTEYRGTDYEGQPLTMWLAKSPDLCLAEGNFESTSFHGLSHIQLDGETYIVSKYNSNTAFFEVTAIVNETYSFDPTGYKPY